jgi:hypothetical protein
MACVQTESDGNGMLDANFLLASLIWGSIGFGYCIYGKRQQQWVPMTGGVVMIAASYFFSAMVMSLVCVGVIAIVYWMLKQGY